MTHLIAFAIGYVLGRRRGLQQGLEQTEESVIKALGAAKTITEGAVEAAHAFGMSWRHAASVWRNRAMEMKASMSPSKFDDMEDPDPLTKH